MMCGLYWTDVCWTVFGNSARGETSFCSTGSLSKLNDTDGFIFTFLNIEHARACSILRKVKMKPSVSFNLLSEPVEQKLVSPLAEFPNTVQHTSVQYKPHIICHYLLNLAQTFNEFYHAQQVISDNKDLMNARLYLVDCVRQVLENGLNVLGIT